MHRFRDLRVWQRAMGFVVKIYGESRQWPVEEKFGLIAQIRRAANSIPLNIAEGAGNGSEKEFCRFLRMGLRSVYEVMTAIEIAHRLNFLPPNRANSLVQEADEIAAMLVGLMRTLGGRRRQ